VVPGGGKPLLRVLFICTENAGRSQIAEALLRHKGRSAFHVASAGSHPARQVHPMAVEILREQGIAWDGRPKGLEEVVDQPWDLIITLCDRAREVCPSFPGQPVYAHWGMPDPSRAPSDVAAQRQAFTDAVLYLRQRIDFLVLLPSDKLRQAALAHRQETGGKVAKPRQT
jgi:protein-tyrosine-phosphatase